MSFLPKATASVSQGWFIAGPAVCRLIVNLISIQPSSVRCIILSLTCQALETLAENIPSFLYEFLEVTRGKRFPHQNFEGAA